MTGCSRHVGATPSAPATGSVLVFLMEAERPHSREETLYGPG
jgi:hypothetical protein